MGAKAIGTAANSSVSWNALYSLIVGDISSHPSTTLFERLEGGKFALRRKAPAGPVTITLPVRREAGPLQNLLIKYRPMSLAHVVGQSAATCQLATFARAPYPTAFIFHGPTGVGKSCTARAFAFDLGCDQTYEDMGGINEIPSGKQDGKAVQDLLRSLSLRPLYGNGWKVAVVNEADYMTAQAEAIWLDGLEHLPPKTVIVFTTNNLHKMTDRLMGRCEVIGFSGDSPELIAGMQSLARAIWKAETGSEPESLPNDLGLMDRDESVYSVRLAVQEIQPLIRQQLEAAQAA
jgi:DNA polymerase III delta prime subunit